MTTKMPCKPDELRTLFLFEALTDEQLEVLCANGHIQDYEPGPICVEGEPATCFYVLIEGELTMSQALRRPGHRNEPDITARRVLRCLAGVHRREAKELRRVGARDQAVAVLRHGRPGVRQVHEGPVSDGGSPARRASPSAPTGPAASSTTGRSCSRWAGCRPA